jgi:hypothetical protein
MSVNLPISEKQLYGRWRALYYSRGGWHRERRIHELRELRRSVFLKGSHMTPDVTDHARIANWLERYRRAWIDRNAISAGELFTADAVYREQPFQAPFVGRQAIRQYWATVTATQTEIELRYGPLIVSGHHVAVEWWANLRNGGAPVTLAGEFFLSFAESGLCRELREYWAFTEGRVEPPDSFLPELD